MSGLHSRFQIEAVDAGVQAAATVDVETIALEPLAAQLGIPLPVFTADFPTLESFLEAMQLRYLDGRLNRVVRDAGHLAAGRDRMRAAWTAYLDFSLENADLATFCQRSRRRFPALRPEVVKRNAMVVGLFTAELSALKVSSAPTIARLTTAMVFEVARGENDSRKTDSIAREAIWHFIETRLPKS